MLLRYIDVDFNHIKNAIPSFVTIITMVLAYSITDGIGMGIITFVILDVIIYIVDTILKNKGNKVKPHLETTWVTGIIFILFLIYFLVPTIF